MMKHIIVLAVLSVGCSLDDSDADPSTTGSQESVGSAAEATAGSSASRPSTATSTPTTQPTAAGARAPIASTQPSAAGTSAPQPSAAGARAPMTNAQPGTAGASAPAMNAAGAAAPVLCEVLENCCPALSDPTLRSTCEGVAKARAESACAQITPMLCAGGPNTSTQSACETLSTCCATLEEEDQEDCQGAVDEADPAACEEAQAELCPATTGTPGTTTDDCPKLMGCCMSLSDDEDQEECLEVVTDADAAACSESLTELCPDPNAPPPPESDD